MPLSGKLFSTTVKNAFFVPHCGKKEGGPLRNYLFTRAIYYSIDIFDDTHTLVGTQPGSVIGGSDVDLQSGIEANNQMLLNSLPIDWSIEPHYPNDPFNLYFLLDKDSLLFIVKPLAALFVQDAITNRPPFWPTLVQPDKSPRKTGWTDPAGVKRRPTPSDRGKTTQAGASSDLGIPAALANLITVFQAEGDFRSAGIVKFALDSIENGSMTILEAIEYLTKAGIF